MIKTFDAIVIGAGQAGPSLAGRLSGARSRPGANPGWNRPPR
jgi:pyruvate/2-oxoglutarate dehydrogenase complex dihydrolipoamide dehydrogenase (E3) component